MKQGRWGKGILATTVLCVAVLMAGCSLLGLGDNNDNDNDNDNDATLPGTVTGVSATSTATGANLSWTAASGSVDGYYVYRQDPLATDYSTYFYTTTISYTDDTVTESGDYLYWVTAYNTDGESAAISNVVTVTVTVAAGTGADTDIAVSTTWSTNTHVTADISVLAGATLTISPGVTVTFDYGVSLSVDDTAILSAVGTSASPIVFKAATDLSASYATGSYSDGAWDNIYIYTGGVGTFDYVTIQDTGSGYNAIDGSGSLTISNSTITNNFSGGIDASSMTAASITNCVFGVNDWYLGYDPTTHGTNGLYDIDIWGNVDAVSGLPVVTQTGNTVTSGRYALYINP